MKQFVQLYCFMNNLQLVMVFILEKLFSLYIYILDKKNRRKAPHLYSHLNTATVSGIFVAMVWGCDNYKMGNYGGTEIILQVQSQKSQVSTL